MSPKLKPLRLPPVDPAGVDFVARRLPERESLRLHFPGSAVRFLLNAEHRFSFPASPPSCQFPDAGRTRSLHCLPHRHRRKVSGGKGPRWSRSGFQRETHLGKLMVGRESLTQSELPHHDEAGAVGEGKLPVLSAHAIQPAVSARPLIWRRAGGRDRPRYDRRSTGPPGAARRVSGAALRNGITPREASSQLS
jgi:hypothetical protein